LEDFDRRHAKTRDEGPVVSDPAAAAKKQECHGTTIANVLRPCRAPTFVALDRVEPLLRSGGIARVPAARAHLMEVLWLPEEVPV
jgi:hypothetical protein